MKYETGIAIAFQKKVNEKEALHKIKDAGIKHVMPHGKLGDFEGTIEYAKGLGLGIPFVHLDYTYINNLWQEGTKKEEEIKRKIESLKACKRCGIDTVVIHPTELDSSTITVERVSKIDKAAGLESYTRILRTAQELGIKIALENLKAVNIPLLEHLLDNIESPYLGFCYDAGHHYAHVPHMDLMGKYGHRCFAIHISDNNMDDIDLHLLPFDGKIDFARVMKEIGASSYDKGVILLEVRWDDVKAGKRYADITPVEFLERAKRAGDKLSVLEPVVCIN